MDDIMIQIAEKGIAIAVLVVVLVRASKKNDALEKKYEALIERYHKQREIDLTSKINSDAKLVEVLKEIKDLIE